MTVVVSVFNLKAGSLSAAKIAVKKVGLDPWHAELALLNGQA